MWRELLVYTFSFLIISCIYRTCLHPDQQIIVEKLIRCGDNGSVKEDYNNFLSGHRWCRNQSTGVPITFLLGFYVSLVVRRWWEQYCKLPWPDDISLSLRGVVTGEDNNKVNNNPIRLINLI